MNPGRKAMNVERRSALNALIPAYLEDRREDLRTLRALLCRSDTPGIEIIGHKLKGSGGSYGFPAISSIGGAIEEAAGTGDLAALAEMLDCFREELDRITASRSK